MIQRGRWICSNLGDAAGRCSTSPIRRPEYACPPSPTRHAAYAFYLFELADARDSGTAPFARQAKGQHDGALRSEVLFSFLRYPQGVDIYMGPDGLKTDSAGNLYIAQFEGSRVLFTGPDGKLIRALRCRCLSSNDGLDAIFDDGSDGTMSSPSFTAIVDSPLRALVV